MNRLAANLASGAYSRTHDAGGSIHPTGRYPSLSQPEHGAS